MPSNNRICVNLAFHTNRNAEMLPKLTGTNWMSLNELSYSTAHPLPRETHIVMHAR